MLTVDKDTSQKELYKKIRSVGIEDLEPVLCADKTFLVIHFRSYSHNSLYMQKYKALKGC